VSTEVDPKHSSPPRSETLIDAGTVLAGDMVFPGGLRLDGRSATFVITGVREYAKDSFPTLEVYGNTAGPTLRLVTCGGAFDRASGHYVSNIIAYGELAA